MVSVLFENIKARILTILASSNRSIKVVSAYFSDPDLFQALCISAQRQIDVELIISDDPANTYESKIDYSELINSGGKFYLANRNPVRTLVHHKFCIVDDLVVITGSFNWTSRASSNRENVLIIENTSLASHYTREFEYVKEEYSKALSEWNEISVPCGYAEVDKITNGFSPGELVLFCGMNRMGKSDFILNICLKIVENFNIPVGYINSNLTKDQSFLKLMSIACKINYSNLRSGSLQDYEEYLFAKRSEDIKELHLFINESGGDISELEKRCKALWFKGVKIILVDRIDHLLSKYDQNEDYNQRVMQRLKALSRLLRIPIVVVSELNLNNLNTKNFNPNLIELRHLGVLGQIADTVASIKRNDYYELSNILTKETTYEVLNITFLKQFFGQTGMSLLKYDPHFGLIEDYKEDFFDTIGDK